MCVCACARACVCVCVCDTVGIQMLSPTPYLLQHFAQSEGMKLLLISAKNGNNIEAMFVNIAEEILELRKQTGKSVGNHGYTDSALSLGYQNSLQRNQGSMQFSLDTSGGGTASKEHDRRSRGCSC